MYSPVPGRGGGCQDVYVFGGMGALSCLFQEQLNSKGELGKGSSGEAREVLRDAMVSSPGGPVSAHWADTNSSGWW